MPMNRITADSDGQPAAKTARTTARRRFLQGVGVAVIGGLAGCQGGEGSGDGTNGHGEAPGGGSTDDGDQKTQPDEVVIGSNHPLTGPIAYTGTRMDQAVKLAATIKNEAGGIDSMGGAEVRVISGDNQGQQELGSEVAQELVDDEAHVLTGCFSSPVTEDATRVAEAERTPFVISSAADASILQETPLEYVYRPQPSSARMAADHAKMTTALLGENGREVDTAALFYLENSYGQSIRDGLRDALPDHGIDIVEETAINFGQTAETHVTQFRDSDPDMIVSTTFENQTIELVRAMEDQDYQPPLLTGVANAAFVSPTALEEMGEVINGALTTGYGIDQTSEYAQDVVERYGEEYGEPMDNNVGMAYGATEVIIAAFERAGTTDKEALNDTLAEIEVSDHILAMPPVSFREDGENENASSVVSQIQELLPRVVYPEAFAEREPRL